MQMCGARSMHLTSCSVLHLVLLLVGASADWIQGDGYTYSVPGQSFTEYSPHWTDTSSYGFRFSFKTFTATAFLARHHFQGHDGPEVLVSLSQGSVMVSHTFNGIRDAASNGKGGWTLRLRAPMSEGADVHLESCRSSNRVATLGRKRGRGC
jgi:hypothetical protein